MLSDELVGEYLAYFKEFYSHFRTFVLLYLSSELVYGVRGHRNLSQFSSIRHWYSI